MTWTRARDDDSRWAWVCSDYSDLQYADINNLAEYGQPYSPYNSQFDQDFVPDFQYITVKMPQHEVMFNGYGQLVRPKHFPIVEKFLNGEIKLNTNGAFTFAQLVSQNLAEEYDRSVSASLYGFSKVPVTPGTITRADAAYVHGSVTFALMSGTIFTVNGKTLTVRAEIGAKYDNWNFESSSRIAKILNPIVAATFGPDHNNLEAKPGEKEAYIRIKYFGPGKVMSETMTIK